jgi:hypothetical protein
MLQSSTPKGRRRASRLSPSYHATPSSWRCYPPKTKKPQRELRFFCFRTRWAPIRTTALLPVIIKVTFNEDLPVYQKLAPKIKQLKALGMTNQEIADGFKISRKSVAKGLLAE